MLKECRRAEHTGPLIVHCSAGVGRTGTVIWISWLLDQVKAYFYITPREALYALRSARARLVENTMQYKFGHEVLLEVLYGAQTYLPCSEFIARLTELRDNIIILQQYKKLKSLPKDLSFKFAKDPDFAHLNRNPEILPADSRILFLQQTSANQASQYINVVRINGFDRKDMYLAGEHPQTRTVGNMWQLIYEQQVAVWVHLHTFPHNSQEYPMVVEGEGTQTLGKMQLDVAPSQDFENFSERWVTISFPKSKIAKPHHLIVLTVSGWAHTDDLPATPDSLLATLEKAESVISPNHPGLLTCKDGMTGCGVGASLLLVLARIRLFQEVDVYRAVLSVLYDRPAFITSPAQYDFLHTVVETYLKKNDHYENFN